jgi:hypothetical protein
VKHASVRKARTRRLLDLLFLGQARLCLGLVLGQDLLLVLVIALGARPVLGGESGTRGSTAKIAENAKKGWGSPGVAGGPPGFPFRAVMGKNR